MSDALVSEDDDVLHTPLISTILYGHYTDYCHLLVLVSYTILNATLWEQRLTNEVFIVLRVNSQHAKYINFNRYQMVI